MHRNRRYRLQLIWEETIPLQKFAKNWIPWGASHVDTFREWVTDFADSAGKNAKLEDVWSDPENMKADIGKCMDGWEQNHDYSDTDCRMTAFLLLDGLLHAESTEDNYEGTYLMFDTEAIDNVEKYETIKRTGICLPRSMEKRVLRIKTSGNSIFG